MTDVALDLEVGGVLVDFCFLGDISTGASVGLGDSCTGDRIEEERMEALVSVG